MHSVLVYHTISSPPHPLPANIDVSPSRFESHLRWLKRRRRVVTLDESLSAPARARLVAITFDDGYRDNLTVALPLLEKYALPVTLFVTAGFVNRQGFLSADELRTLAAHPLVTIGAHGLRHRHLTRLTIDEARCELKESRQMLSEMTHCDVDLMAYPYGDCNLALERLCAACGYRAAWSVWNGANTRHSLWRVPLGRRDILARFVAKVSSCYFPIKRCVRPPRIA